MSKTKEDYIGNIESLFISYKEAFVGSNNSSILDSIQMKITSEAWKVLHGFYKMSELMDENPEAVTKGVKDSISSGLKIATLENFFPYMYVAVKKELSRKISSDAFGDNLKMHIPENKIRSLKKLKTTYKRLTKFYSDSDFANYAVDICGYNKKVVDLFFSKTISLTQKKSSGEEYSYIDSCSHNKYYTEKTSMTEQMDSVSDKLHEFNEKWSIQKDSGKPILSDLLTGFILERTEKVNPSLDEECVDELINFFCSFAFIERTMVVQFFKNPNYLIPTQQAIGKKYGLTKFAANAKLNRFLVGLLW